MPLATLPVELWELILDSIIENVVNPVNHCDYMNFVQITHQMRDPERRPPIDPSYRRLRLVCRFFNDLLSLSPYLTMRNTKDQIQRCVRAVYLRPSMDGMSCLKLLIGDPSISRRLVSLDLKCDLSSRSRYPRARYNTIAFDFLCQNSPSLSNVRYLRLGIISYGKRFLNFQFWTELNAAFPLLVCLALRPYFHDATINILQAAEGTVTLDKLKILKLDGLYLYNGLHMPQLRHVALGRCSQSTITALARSRHLESALFLQNLDSVPLDLSFLPTLKLLGILYSREDDALPFPPSYPSVHLCVNIRNDHGRIQGLPKWLLKAFDRMPQVLQITLDILTLLPRNRSYMEGVFRRDLESNGLVVNPFLPGATYMIIKRAAVVEPNVNSNRLWRRWTTFLHRSSPQA